MFYVNKMQKLFDNIKSQVLFNNNNNLPVFTNDKTCIENWVDWLIDNYPYVDNYKQFKNMIKPLIFKQYKYMLLVRYGNIYDFLDNNTTVDDFWNLYDGLYRECRSVVIDINTSDVIILPMDKFFNVNELQETSYENIIKKINDAKALYEQIEFSNKLDGSMICARYYYGKLILSSSQSLDIQSSWRLKDAYSMLSKNYIKMMYAFPSFTYVFEYISQKDAHVVKYSKKQEGLYLIGIRDNISGYTFSYSIVKACAERYKIKSTELFDTSFDKIMNSLDDVSSDKAEGFVVNINGYRVKIKYNDYVLMHHTLSAILSPNYIIKSIADGSFDDLLSKIPSSYLEDVNNISQKVYTFIDRKNTLINNYFIEAKKILTEDDFFDRKSFVRFISSQYDKVFFHYLIQKHDNKAYNLLQQKNGKYIKINDINQFLTLYPDDVVSEN